MIARVLVPLFPSYADRKIAEVFAIATPARQRGGTPRRRLRLARNAARWAAHREVFGRELPTCRA
jgi:hypothetical protein